MTVNSLSFRLAAGALLWITVALVAAGFVLSGLFRDHVERSFERQILDQLDRLAAVSEIGPRGAVKLKHLLTDPRFERPYSGWYWQVAGPAGAVLRSRSLWDQVLDVDPQPIAAAEPQRYTAAGPRDQILWGLRRNVTLPGSGLVYQISVAADVSELRASIKEFDSTLAMSLAVLGLGLLAAVMLQVRYGLSPLRRLRAALAAVRAGRATRLEGGFPDEVTPMANELNALLDHNAAVVERARTHAGNLAHALKTPLTVIANATTGADGALADTVRQQTATMSGLIDHHLARARVVAAGGRLGVRTDVLPVAEELKRTLARIHAERELAVALVGGDGLAFLGERQDLQEMVGNLMDNACKWARGEVRVTFAGEDGRLRLSVDDDGPGLAPEARARVFDRGRRLDEAVPGSGLGLAIVGDVAELYGGSVSLGESDLGGLRAVLDLPAG
ncbi:MAG: sensor histidine kinase [Alphaproteobacteria bacterium]